MQDHSPHRSLSAKLARFYLGINIVFWPFTDFATRFFVALFFLRSGIVKASDWDNAVALATYEYPVEWMSPVAAASTGLAIELVAPILLLIGFMVRPAALALAILTVVAQSEYIPTTTNLMLIALLIWYVIHGAASISVDFYWARKWRSKANSIGEGLLAVGAWSRRHLALLYILVIRLWLGTSLLIYAGTFEPSIGLATWMPITSFSGLPDWVAVLFALLLITGTAASLVSYALTFVIAAFMLTGAHPDVTFYPVLLLSIYESRGAGVLSIDQYLENWLTKKFPQFGADDDIDPDDWIGTLRSWIVALKSGLRQIRQ